MYSEWSSMSGLTESVNDRISVLEKLPLESAKEVVIPIVRSIVTTLGISQPPLPSPFGTDKEVEWNLQVICFGLSLPLSDHEIIKDCVSVYCEWLSCLAPVPKLCVPKPITERPNFYARKMINHLYHLFTPRKGEAQDTINRQAVLCHRVLRTIQSLIKTSEILDEATWECTLLFLIGINDSLLSPPGHAHAADSAVKEDIGDQLCDRILSVLFEVWLLACSKSFPSPVLWKTFRTAARCWRHRGSLFDQWAKVNLLLTGRVLHIMYGGDYVRIDDDLGLIPRDMNDDCTVQTWYRFLHCVGNPVELTQPTIISQTQSFLQYAIASEAVVDPCQHPCLSALPGIFLQAMKGIATMVDAFLGISPPTLSKILEFLSAASPSSSPEAQSSNNPSPAPPMRRIAKSFSVAPSSNLHKGLPKTNLLGLAHRSKDTSSLPSSSHSSLQSQQSVSIASAIDLLHHQRPLPSALRPRVNSILHLFGPWLFEASLISCDTLKSDDARRTSRGSAVPAALPENIDMPSSITIDKYYQGRAEALGTLCRIFCSKKTGEEILPAYLARFYIAVKRGLSDTRNDVLGSILSNSSNLFRVDLDGVSILVPAIVSALETVLPQKDALRNDLRRPAIQLLLSLLPLPLHFMNVPIKDSEKSAHGVTFLQLKPRLANLLLNTLQIEMDSVNIQILLGGLMMLLTDVTTFEEIEKLSIGNDSPTQVISSENTSMKSFSDYSNSFDDHPVGHTFAESVDSNPDSASALFVRSIYLTCHRLISTWKSDLPVSLAALELLNGLAKTRLHDHDPLECRRAVKWICDFIMQQCSRPPPAHSKDLHSSIVAAFQCVTTWLTRHPFLLDDKDCLATVLEVVEYGISGTKSMGKPGEPVKYKDEKNQSPVSLRVRDAAEALLGIIFEQMGGYSTNDVGAKSSALVDEISLFQQICDEAMSPAEIISHFRYYIMDQSILIALLEDPIYSDTGMQPIVTSILRGPTGRHAWSLQHRHMSKHQNRSFGDNQGNYPGRPLPISDVGVKHDVKQKYFPDGASKIQYCKADKSIPPLETATSDDDSLEQSRLSIILENQIRLEKRVASNIQEERVEAYANYKMECNPPEVAQEFQTARLLLSHLGFTSVQQISDLTVRQLVPVNSATSEFMDELDSLDGTSCRTFDTVHVFYVKAGQSQAVDILNNVNSKSNVHPHFMEFLHNLGWPIWISRHSGWTGSIATSWKRIEAEGNALATGLPDDASPLLASHGGAAYNGELQVLYWSDVISEISFVVPTAHTVFSQKEVKSTNEHPQEGSAARPRKNTVSGKTNPVKMFCVWLESFEDCLQFPAGELMQYCSTGLETSIAEEPNLIIFIQSLRNGLFRIHLAGPASKMGFATPLIDGMVLSRRVLGNLVRQTALNMAKRKRLENENSQPPHVRRKLKIQEIRNKFMMNLSESEMHTHFFKNLHSPPCKVGEDARNSRAMVGNVFV